MRTHQPITRRRGPQGAAAAIAVVAILGGPLAVSAAAPARTHPEGGVLRARAVGHEHRSSTPLTAVTVVVRRCAGCTIQPVRYVPAEGDAQWWGPIRRVGADGQVTFRLAPARTRGLTFFVDAPWHGDDDTANLAVIRYGGKAIGDPVSPTVARTTHRATPCWAGTDRASARIVLHVDKVPTRTAFTGRPTHHPRAYATRTLAYWPPMTRTWKGSVNAQDAFGCTRPPAPADGPIRAALRSSQPAPVTTMTLTAPGCAGCRVTLGQWRAITRPPWRSPTRTVRHGRVRFTVPTDRTHGMQVAVTAPWEGVTGYQTFVVFRYAGHRPGAHVGFRAARRQSRGSACWAGTTAGHSTLALAVRRVRVYAAISGSHVPGTIAWTPLQRHSWEPTRHLVAGVYGSEEATVCRPG
jgi:hypothetical protein